MKPSTLLRLYPRQWRERYGDEMLALLNDTGIGRRIVIDVIAGAMRERLRPLTRAREPVAFTDYRCPHCRQRLARDEWFELWRRTGPVSGALVRPCLTCDSLLRLTPARQVEVALRVTGCTMLQVVQILQMESSLSRGSLWVLIGIAFAVVAVSVHVGGKVDVEVVPLDYGEVAR